MDRRLALAIGLVVAALTLAGCIQDLERRPLDPAWEPDVQVHESAYPDVHGAPAMVVAEGSIQLPADVNVTLTSLDGELVRGNDTIALEAMRVAADEGTQRARPAQDELGLVDGEELSVTYVPADDAPRRAQPDGAWNLSLELQWRYRSGGEFDAGRLEVERNLTPDRVPELGVGVAQREGGEVHRLVFEAIDVDELPDEVGVEVAEVGGGDVDKLATVNASTALSNGTARLTFAENVTVPEGSGYLVFRLQDVDGTATTGLRAAEDPVPAPGGFVTLAAIGAATLVVAARRRRRQP